MKLRHLALVVLVDIIWAVNIVAVKVSVDAVQPLTANMLRYVIVLIVCLPWLRWLPGRMRLVLVTGVVAGALFMGLGGCRIRSRTMSRRWRWRGSSGCRSACCWPSSSITSVFDGCA